MKLIISLLFVGFLISCSSDEISKSESAAFIGQWRLIQTGYGDYDPNTGEFFYTFSDFYIDGPILQFHPNGYIETTMDYCQTNSSSTYLYPYFIENKTIKPDCFSDENFIQYSLRGDTLLISGPCVEGCMEKYIRTEN